MNPSWKLGGVIVAAIAIGAVTLPAASPDAASTVPAKPTFSKDVAPIFQAKCQSCHEPGSIAPMSLITYEEARPWARSIRQRVSTRQMPPWHIDKSVGVQKFKNDMSLTDEQVDTIVSWVDQGAPQGNPADMPPPKPVNSTLYWQAERDGYGPPDIVVKSRRADDAGRASGRVVAPDVGHPRPHRASLGEDGGDSADQSCRPKDSSITRSPTWC